MVSLETTKDWTLPATMPKSTYKARLENIAAIHRHTDTELAEYFDLNKKSFYKIKIGKTKRPRKPFADKLNELESNLIQAGIKNTEVQTKDSLKESLTEGSLSKSNVQAKKDTELRMFYFNILFPTINDEWQKKIIKFVFEVKFRKQNTGLETQMKKDLDFL